MKQLYTILLASVLLVFGAPTEVNGQCTAGTTAVPAGAWGAPSLPPSPPWGSNVPPAVAGTALAPPCNMAGYGTNCNLCPATWNATVATGNRAFVYLCAGNLYTITTCSTPTTWDSNITISTTANVVVAYDDNGCGAPGGHASMTFSPATSATYFIRVYGPGCSTPASTAFLQIQCSAGPCPSAGDDPCASTPPASCNPNIASCPAVAGATAFPALNSACTTLNGSTAGATGTSGVGPPSCGVYPNSGDVWFSAAASAGGTLALDVDHVSASNLAMAMYSTTGGCTPGNLAQIACNADLVAGTDLSPYISMSGLTPGATYYIRIWPEGNVSNGGNFTLCAYHPVPPVNDQPCGSINLSMSSPTCVPATFNTQDATPLSAVTVSAGSPTCTGGVAGNDVWFRITVPAPGGQVTVNSLAGSLNNMAMALYTGACGGPLTEIACNGAFGMPNIALATVFPTGTVLYVRMWNQATGFGTFQLCAFLTQPPPNDEPCGAIALPVRYGCLMSNMTTGNATQTSSALFGAGSVPNPTCGGTPNNDVWFSAVVPPNGQLLFDTDRAQMTDAALAVYRFNTGGCPGGGNLVQVACIAGGSANSAAMPRTTVTGLTPGTTVYIRMWRESGVAGNAFICASRTDTPPVNPGVSCYFTLRMQDSGGDGWNGSYVTINIGGVNTNYTIESSSGTISFPVNQGQAWTISYTAVGGFQNQISYSVVTNQNGLVYSSPAAGPGPTGFVASGSADCSLPPALPSDCAGAFRICSSTSGLGGNPSNTGAVVDLNSSNRGCLNAENQGLWYTFSASTAGTLTFSLTPTAATYTDYDFALWGPYTSMPTCPNGPVGPPARCSWAAGGGATGLNMSSVDLTEGAGGDSWVRFLNMNVGDYYILYLDNWSRNGISFNFTFGGTASLSCEILPVELLEFDARPIGRQVDVNWSTSAERNSSHFFVERSGDGVHFETIGRVEGAGNSLVRTDYKFTDTAPYNGANYYRLRQVDIGGQSLVSDVISVVFRNGGVPLFVYPNPAKDALQASFGSLREGTIKWRIMDTSGRQVGMGSNGSSEGINQFAVPVSDLEPGSYMLEVIDQDGSQIGVARFVKQ